MMVVVVVVMTVTMRMVMVLILKGKQVNQQQAGDGMTSNPGVSGFLSLWAPGHLEPVARTRKRQRTLRVNEVS